MNTIENLLIDNLIAFYWVGFILADGYLTDKKLVLRCSFKDKDHLLKLKNYLNLNEYSFIRTTNFKKNAKYFQIFGNNKYLLNLRNKFDIKDRKTYNPPDFNRWNFTKEQLTALFIGYIDGDGTIYHRFSGKSNKPYSTLRFNIHSSWISCLDFYKILFNDFSLPNPVINKFGYANWHIGNNAFLRYLLNFAIENKIPYMERKWNKINLDIIDQKGKGLKRKETAIKLKKDGFKNGEIAKIIGVSPSSITSYLKDLENDI